MEMEMEMLRIWLVSASLLLTLVVSYCNGGNIPLAGILAISMDKNTNLYTVTVDQGSLGQKKKQLKLILDLSNANIWTTKFDKKTARPVSCSSPLCAMSTACNAYICGGKSCFFDKRNNKKKMCGALITNPSTATTTSAELWQDKLLLNRTAGTNPSKLLLYTDFPFACAPNGLRLPALADGVFGLSRAQISAPRLLSRRFGFPPIFTYCLSGSSGIASPLFFGGGNSPTYHFHATTDIATEHFTFTPLLTFKEAPDEYFLQVHSISVENTLMVNAARNAQLPIDKALLNLNPKTGRGGMRISTLERYTRLEPSIYKVLSKAFVDRAAEWNIPKVAAVPPFKTCFDTSKASWDRRGLLVPEIIFNLSKVASSKSKWNPTWAMTSQNSLIPVHNYIHCLAFLEAKPSEKSSIVVGTFQQEEGLVRFDLKSNVFGFFFNLPAHRTNCALFKFDQPFKI